MNKNPILSVTNLTKKFGSFTAVNDLSFQLNEGEILGLLGPNGAGKTTTIQMLLGIMKVTSGNITYFGKNLSRHRSEILQQVGFGSTYVQLPDRLTVRENLDIYAQLYSMPSEVRSKKITQFLDLFDMTTLQDKNVGALSTGQQTRVMLIKAFLASPRIVLLDEPTASLDPDVAQNIRHFIMNLQQEQQTSVILTSHNMVEVSELCDRILVIKEGKLFADSTPEALVESIGTARVELVLLNGTEQIATICHDMQLSHETRDKAISISLPESAIASLLARIARENIQYSHISIDKPSLEDYFLTVVKKRNS